jgi:hypothetical protein
MARKRGGLAGLYDRNKGAIRTGATIGASLLGGPMAGAATGAAFRGLDREGKRGIGFDIGQGALGGIEGYALGKGTQGVKGLLTGAKTLPPALMKVGVTGGPETMVTGSGGAGTLTQRAKDLFSLANQKTGNKLGSYEMLGDIVKGLYGTRKDMRENALEREKLDQAQRQFDATLGLKTRETNIMAAQEADRKRREDELMAARAAVRAMFGGA